jgi:hypothetical protein
MFFVFVSGIWGGYISDFSEEYTAAIFRVTGLLQVNVKVMQSKKCVSVFSLLDWFGPSCIWKMKRRDGFVLIQWEVWCPILA